MGLCMSGEKLSPDEERKRKDDKIRAKWIDDHIKEDLKADKDAIKLLFLGAGESGKSTMLKQMKLIHTVEKFTQEEKLQYVPLVHQNILQSTKTLCKQSDLQPPEHKTRVTPENQAAKDKILGLKYDEKLTPQLAEAVKSLWNDPGIRATYDHRSSFQLTDSTEYFYGRLDAVVQPDYLPSNDDILRARIRTTGIVEHTFVIEDNEFRMFDVGGQRNARKKWIHCFENVTSVIFVAAMSAYDQVLYEDTTTNRMHEALNLFEDILDSKWFMGTPMILFLNKKDIFREKIQRVPLTVCFPYFEGECTYRKGCVFIKEEFKARNHNPDRKIYTHYTCATDTENFQRVFADVQSIILRLHLIDVGLMDPQTDLAHEDGDHDEYDDGQP